MWLRNFYMLLVVFFLVLFGNIAALCALEGVPAMVEACMIALFLMLAVIVLTLVHRQNRMAWKTGALFFAAEISHIVYLAGRIDQVLIVSFTVINIMGLIAIYAFVRPLCRMHRVDRRRIE